MRLAEGRPASPEMWPRQGASLPGFAAAVLVLEAVQRAGQVLESRKCRDKSADDARVTVQ
jgi:hypothetical protein